MERAGFGCRNRGFIVPAISPTFVAFGLLFAIGSVYVAHCEHVKRANAAFIEATKAAGKAAESAAKKQADQDRKDKEKADEENQRLSGDNQRLARLLRDARAASSFVPPAEAGAKHPDRAHFDRAELERAIQQLDAGVSGLVAEGDEARIGLDTARRWARQ